MLSRTLFALAREWVGQTVNLPGHQLRTEYNPIQDALYVRFQDYQEFTESVVEADGNIYHYNDEMLVGITLLHPSGSMA